MASSDFKYVIFVLLIVLIVSFGAVLYLTSDLILANLVWFLLLLFFIFVFWKGKFLVPLKDFERVVIYRFGKVSRVGGPGWTLIIPFFESVTRVDLRVQTIDVPKQDVITMDSVEIKIDAIIYIKVLNDPQSVVNSVIAVEDYRNAVKLYVVARIRDIIGSLNLSEVISNVEDLNVQLKKDLESLIRSWGIGVDAVEIKDVDIPKRVLDAMHEQKAAVQQKLARIERALGQKAEIEAINEAASELSETSLSYFYIRALEELSRGKSSKIIFPFEFSKFASALSGKFGVAPQQDAKSIESSLAPYKDLLEDYINKAVKKSNSKKNIEEKSKSRAKSSRYGK